MFLIRETSDACAENKDTCQIGSTGCNRVLKTGEAGKLRKPTGKDEDKAIWAHSVQKHRALTQRVPAPGREGRVPGYQQRMR